MKSNIKFMMALGKAKLVMLSGPRGNTFYTSANNALTHKSATGLKRIVTCLNGAK